VLDPTGHVATWNPGAERIKGYPGLPPSLWNRALNSRVLKISNSSPLTTPVFRSSESRRSSIVKNAPLNLTAAPLGDEYG